LMKMKLTFTVPGPPVPKARARVVSRVEDGETKTRGVTPTKTRAYEKHVGVIAHATRVNAYQSRALVEPWPYASKLTRFGLLVKVYYSGAGGDGDNYVKSIADACNGVLWVDDRQIDDGRWIKAKVERGKERVEVETWVI